MPDSDWSSEPHSLSTGSPKRRAVTLLIAGAMFVAFGAVAVSVVPTAELTCERLDSAIPSCRLAWHVFFDQVRIRQLSIRELRGVQGVSLEREMDPRVRRVGTTETNYQLVLSTETGDRLVNLLGEAGPITSARVQIAAFLDNASERELKVTTGPTGAFVWIRRVGNGIVLFGLLLWVWIPFLLIRSP